MKFVILIFCLVFIVANCFSCFVFGRVGLYEPYFGVDVGDFVERAVLRAEGVVGGRAVTKLIGGTVTALDDDGDAWGWCLFAGVGEDGESADGDGKRVRIDFYFEPNDGGRVRLKDMPKVPDGADANDIPILKMIDSLDGLVLFPRRVRRSAMIKALRVGNQRGWIGGSYYTDHDGKVFRPMLFIPNDFDNDGIPDIREILQARLTGGTELDNNGNWMLDWAENAQGVTGGENMRAGLHAPGMDGSSAGTHMLLVNYVQIVRFPAQIAKLPVGQNVNVNQDSFGLGDVVEGTQQAGTGTSSCITFFNRVHEWGTSDGGSGDHQREIVITVTNPNPDSAFSDLDLPLTPADSEYQPAIDTLQTFAFRFAHCIDYMQFGNESLKGSSNWGNRAGTPLFNLDNTEFTDLLAKGVNWTQDQAEVVRIGSALAGRPLRVITPGFPIGVINAGAKGDPNGPFPLDDPNCTVCTGNWNKSARSMRDIGTISLSDRMFYDVHMHYLNIDQANEGLNNVENPALLAWGTNGASQPTMKVMLEYGPKGDKSQSFWPSFATNMNAFFDKQGTPSFATWDLMLKSIDQQVGIGWEKTQYFDTGSGEGFQMVSTLANVFLNNYTAVCYGPSIQGPNAADTFLIAALRASKVKNKGSWLCDSTDEFDPMLHHTCLPGTPLDDGDDGFEEIIGPLGLNFIIPNFLPHGLNDGCDVNISCP